MIGFRNTSNQSGFEIQSSVVIKGKISSVTLFLSLAQRTFKNVTTVSI